MAEFCERHLQRGKQVVATRDDYGQNWCEECFAQEMERTTARQGEKDMRKMIDKDEVARLHGEGHDDKGIAQKLECSTVGAAHVRRSLGLAHNSGRKTGSERLARGVPQLAAPESQPLTMPHAAKNGKGRVRVVVFEIEGGPETLRDAISTVIAALAGAGLTADDAGVKCGRITGTQNQIGRPKGRLARAALLAAGAPLRVA